MPILCLPNLVLVPGMVLPLNIHEPRYLQLVDHVLADGCHIGVALLRPRGERTAVRLPAFETVFGLGKLVHHLPLGDGRRLIRLEALGRVRLVRELPQGPHLYRRAEVVALSEPPVTDKRALAVLRDQVEQLARRWGRDGESLLSLLALPDPRAFLYALTSFLPSLELLAGHDVSSTAGRRALVELQQRSLDADTPEERLAFLGERTAEVLRRISRRHTEAAVLLN